MITGSVNALLESIIPMSLYSHDGRMLAVDALIDTGFNGFLTLPNAILGRLGLAITSYTSAILGNGSEVRFAMFETKLSWHGADRVVSVLETEGSPLIGMALLQGGELQIQVKATGQVTITPMA